MTDDVRLDYWMIEVLQEAMKIWWNTGKRIRYTPTKEVMENRWLDIGKFELIKKRLNEIQVGYDGEIISGLSYDKMFIDGAEVKIHSCPICNKKLEPSDNNPNYFMCMKCVRGWSIEELDFLSFIMAYYKQTGLAWYQMQILMDIIKGSEKDDTT